MKQIEHLLALFRTGLVVVVVMTKFRAAGGHYCFSNAA